MWRQIHFFQNLVSSYTHRLVKTFTDASITLHIDYVVTFKFLYIIALGDFHVWTSNQFLTLLKRGAQVWFTDCGWIQCNLSLSDNRSPPITYHTLTVTDFRLLYPDFNKLTATFIILLISRLLALPLTSYINLTSCHNLYGVLVLQCV